MSGASARRVATFDDLEHAGDYTGPHTVIHHSGTPEEALVPYVWYLLPIHEGVDKFDYQGHVGSGVHGCKSPPWAFRECADGSLGIRESIAAGGDAAAGVEPYWHGYLDEGNVWRRV